MMMDGDSDGCDDVYGDGNDGGWCYYDEIMMSTVSAMWGQRMVDTWHPYCVFADYQEDSNIDGNDDLE